MACEPFDCEKCGQRHERCTGHVDECPACGPTSVIDEPVTLGEPCPKCGTVVTQRACIKWPRKGAAVCQKHGGEAKQIVAAAERRVVEQRLNAEIQTMLGGPIEPISDPYTKMAEVAGKISRTLDFLQEKVEALDDLRSYGGQQGEQIDVVFAAFERALDRTERTLVNMSRLDLDAKIAKLHSRNNDDAAKTIIAALVGALDEAEIKGPVRDVIVNGFGNRLQPGRNTSR